MSDNFVHLHVHSDFSQLDGMAVPDRLMAEVASQGMPAIAITDHGNMAGAYTAYKAAQAAGVKAIVGIEAYLAPDVPRTHAEAVRWANGGEDDVSGSGAYTHMTMLAETTEGMHNLFRLTSDSFTDGFVYKKQRMDRETLSQWSKGIIATTGCPSGEIQTWLRIGNYDRARQSAADFMDIFGRENFFVELMDHGLDIEHRVHADLLRLAKDLNLQLVATNDLHYVRKEDAATHEALLCVQSGTNLNDPNRFKFDSSEFYVKSAEEMRHLFRDLPEACDNTLAIAERCNVEFVEGNLYMPKFPLPANETDTSWFKKEVWRGLKARFGGSDNVPESYIERAKYEVGIISSMGFEGYFLVVADFINWAKDNGIRVGPGRGSVGGSLMAWALGITDLDPIRHGLLFERFLNPERVSMPDIDVDFDDRRRGEVIDYVVEKYGADKVAQIATFQTVKAKAAIKDASRALGYPYALGDRINKTYPPAIMGKDLSLAGVFDPNNARYSEGEEFRKLVNSDADARKVVDLARGFEGVKRGFGMHAAGVIMSGEPIVDHVPLMRRTKDAPVTTQFEYPQCEALGLIKMDFLGLSNLGVIDEALIQIKRNRGIDIDVDAICDALDDLPTYEMLARGETLGVFQLDSPPMRALLKSMKPDQFDDISAVLALYRPGPMGANAHNDYADRKNNRKPVVPIHKELAEPLADILDSTYGVIVYQEQIMAIAQRLAGYTLGKADMLRRAMGKKKKEILDKEYAGFREGMIANGYSEDCVKTLWDILVPFADYAFNRAHSAGYGLISYLTAYLKANFPAEYMAALLTVNSNDKDKTALYLSEARRMGTQILPPDVNESMPNYTAIGDVVRFGLLAIRNLGEDSADFIVASRAESGPFTSLEDYLHRAEGRAFNKKVVESLIKSGAFDCFGSTRSAMFSVYEPALKSVAKARKALEKTSSQQTMSMFDEFPSLPPVPVPAMDEWRKEFLLAQEREMLGLYVSSHPLSELSTALERLSSMSLLDISQGDVEEIDGAPVKVAGLLANVEFKTTKNAQRMSIVTLEDMDTSATVVFFPRNHEKVERLLVKDNIVVIEGRIQVKDNGERQIIAEKAFIPDVAAVMARSEELAPFVITGFTKENLAGPELDDVKETLTRHKGNWPVVIVVDDGETVRRMRVSDGYKVTPSADLLAELQAVLPTLAAEGL